MRLKKEAVAVICCDEVLQYSLKKYRQNRFYFSFKTRDEVLFLQKILLGNNRAAINQFHGKSNITGQHNFHAMCLPGNCNLF